MTSIIQSEIRTKWAGELELELKDNILGFWLKHSFDEQCGGFLGQVNRDLTIVADAPKSLVLNTRLLWTFSYAYRMYGDASYLSAAERAFDYLNKHFADRANGGYYWMLHADGSPLEGKKQIYGQAFAVYAYSEYFRATKNLQALDYAIQAYRLIEQYGYDPVYGGYIEALSEAWEETDDLSLSDKDLNEKKSMNTHLHVLEAYTNLYRVWQSVELQAQLTSLVRLTIKHIVDEHTGHFKLFFDEAWQSQSQHISYGHDIEGSWLLVEAAEVLGDAALLEETKKVALKMADAVLTRGYDTDGGLFNEALGDTIIDDHKDWWPQAEAVVGFYNAYQLTGKETYLEASLRSWRFIQHAIVDQTYGEWYWSVKRDGSPSDNMQKISAWKCPYHNSRACFELLERLQLADVQQD
ncbi:AGE family epimerase/isomerase [Paenibacillus camelliae]|uniref:AGE family epimerase/isomerase n=1 Tax=Paenibacillus camelliae TaxID=512410 RepID=UPI002040111C|nr:AGE family epimerase/isomerase [Paenibacillus camelliae]MCM3635219.1 AGE family epimerase/isomerase [Paenibacillus camelliae]